jgi:hypothetical protein
MPKNILEAMYYIFMLFPGLAFAIARETHRPRTVRSTFRESATVVLVSVICLGAVFSLAVFVGIASQDVRAWINALVVESDNLVRRDSQAFFLVLMGVLFLATALGLLLGGEWAHDLAHSVIRGIRKDRTIKHIDREQSTWETAMSPPDGCYVEVNLKLNSGGWLSGKLYSSTGTSDPKDWALNLLDAQYRPPGGKTAFPASDYSVTLLRGSDVELIFVRYVKLPANEPKSKLLIPGVLAGGDNSGLLVTDAPE